MPRPSTVVPFKHMAAATIIGRAMHGLDGYARFLNGEAHSNFVTASAPSAALGGVRRPLRLGLWALIFVALIAVIWGMLAPIESAAIAAGQVVVQSNRKIIQHLEGGVIEAIFVREGQQVEAGQALVRLSDTSSQANVGVLSGQLAVTRLTEARLIAERDRQDSIRFPTEMVEAAKTNLDMAKAIAAQEHLFSSQREAQEAKISMLKQRIFQTKEEIAGLKAQVTGASGQLALLAEETAAIGSLYQQGLAPKPRLLALQRREAELRGNRGQYQSAIAKAEQSIAATELEIINQQSEFAAKNSSELRDAQALIADLREKLRAASDVAARTVIAAPVAGRVMGLRQHTIGGVVSPAQPIMELVPEGEQLIIEARISPNDIDVVHAGLAAKVQFTAYKTRRMPKVEGKVVSISADKFTEPVATERSIASAYYLARVEVGKDALAALAHPPELHPGMPANVFITTGSRSFLHYLFQPLLDSMDKAFREE